MLPWLLVAGCTQTWERPLTIEQHERYAAHYEATAASIYHECWKTKRHETGVGDPNICWKAHDQRFLQANIDAAEKHRTAAERLRAQQQQATR